ncbi:hypothetical protein PANT_11c00039 [Moesziomyces antarcticus T-34]|uniref:MFS general substrate transporter n=1 Tax=Pseudozyma antarctica (strain T-34) TaxID=1151754 RepID=M9MDG1_PSEA3|nr:hypothetical protein PANT_11c00039 [Moesziomyces antarcticus T-34]
MASTEGSSKESIVAAAARHDQDAICPIQPPTYYDAAASPSCHTKHLQPNCLAIDSAPSVCHVSCSPPNDASRATRCTHRLAQFFTILLPLALVVGVVTADMSNLEFVHLVHSKVDVPMDQWTQPSDDVLNANKLQWTFLQSAYLLPLMLFAGPLLILQFVLLVGRLRAARVVDGLNILLGSTVLVVGTMALLTAFVGTSVVGVIFTRMAAGSVVCSALGLVTQAVELFPASDDQRHNGHGCSSCPPRPPAAGFSIVLFGSIYGLGSSFASCSVFAGYQLATLLQRSGVSFDGTGTGPSQGFRALFMLEGLFIVALAPLIVLLLHLSRRWRPQQHAFNSVELTWSKQDAAAPGSQSNQQGYELADVSLALTVESKHASGHTDAPTVSAKTQDHAPDIEVASEDRVQDPHRDMASEETDDKKESTWLAGLRRFSTPLAGVSILTRGSGGGSTTGFNMQSLTKAHTGFGLWVSAVLRRIMVLVYGSMGVHEAAFDLISAGTSSRETFICGVLIVSNTVIIQLAVVSLIEPLKAPRLLQGNEVADDYLDPALKRVPALPGLPALVGGVSGGISAVVCSMLAAQPAAECARGGRRGMLQRWRRRVWWVPALLTACLAITIVGLALAVVASILVPTGDGGVWMVYAATVVSSVGSTPQLPLALLQIYTVMDAERPARRATSPTVRRIRWERLGAMISTLTTIGASELLTAWVFLMPDAAQKAFLFTSVALAVGGSVWLMLRHTRASRGNRSRALGA